MRKESKKSDEGDSSTKFGDIREMSLSIGGRRRENPSERSSDTAGHYYYISSLRDEMSIQNSLKKILLLPPT